MRLGVHMWWYTKASVWGILTFFSYFPWIQESIMMNMLSVRGLLDIHVGIKKVLEHVWLEFRHKVGFDNRCVAETK